MHPPTSRRHRAAVILRFFFVPHEMALEFVYWAEGVRRPSPQTFPGQGRVRGRLSRLAARVGAEVGLCWCRSRPVWGF